jgi:predicted transcriptional regulator of viral defense system
MTAKPKLDRVMERVRRQGALRLRDLTAYGMHPESVRRLTEKGVLDRVGRGLYVPRDVEFTAEHTLVEVAKRVPRGVICLLSALRFHELGTQMPHQVWVAIDRKAHLPKADGLPIRFVCFSGEALSEGVEKRIFEGVPVRIYSVAKTVADCFKYRNKIGLDVALEALRECRRERKCSADELWRFAQICRVGNVMRPYLEAISWPRRGFLQPPMSAVLARADFGRTWKPGGPWRKGQSAKAPARETGGTARPAR